MKNDMNQNQDLETYEANFRKLSPEAFIESVEKDFPEDFINYYPCPSLEEWSLAQPTIRT